MLQHPTRQARRLYSGSGRGGMWKPQFLEQCCRGTHTMPDDRYHGDNNPLSSGHNRQHLNAQIHHDLSLPTSSQFLSFPLVSAVLAVHPSVRLYLSFYVCLPVCLSVRPSVTHHRMLQIWYKPIGLRPSVPHCTRPGMSLLHVIRSCQSTSSLVQSHMSGISSR